MFLKKSKIVLQSNLFYIILFTFLIIYVWSLTILKKHSSIYENGDAILSGKIISVTKGKNKYSLLIESDEKIKLNYYTNDNLDLLIGMKIKVDVTLKDVDNNTIPNTFNYKKYLYNNKIYKLGNIKKIIDIDKNITVYEKIKNWMYQKCSNNKYLSLFIVGDKSFLENDVYDAYKNIGIGHLLAISGMHVGILILIINKILFFIIEKHRNLLIIILICFYAYIVNFSSSILRVLICFIIKVINKKFNLKVSSLKILLLTAIFMLFYNPFYIYNISFLYSFLCSISIILSDKYLKSNYFFNIIKITFFAMLFTLPVTLSLNYEINLITLLANLIFIPYLTYFLYPFSLISFCIPLFDGLFLFFASIMEKLVLFFNKSTFLVINVPKISFVFIIVYYFLVLLFVYYGYKRLFILIILLVIFFSLKIDSNYYLNFLDVGQGDSLVLITPYQKDVIMIDTGGSYNYEFFDNIILYLISRGVFKITKVIITHGDFDHMGEAINLVNNFKVEKVIFNCGEFNELEQNLIKVLDKNKIQYYSCIKELNIDKNKLYFLQTKKYDNENDNSNVIYTEINGYKFMFMGDAGVEVEKDLIEKYNLKDIDILKVGHHGSKTSSSRNFVDNINPKYSIISVGKNNRYGHPNKEVLDNLKDSKIYRTDIDGSVMFKIKNKKLKIETCAP